MTEIYNHWSSESMSNAVGHVDNNGVVYNHWSRESMSDTVGHVGKDGVIYNHWSNESMSHAIGHVGRDGVIYDHWSNESMSDTIGHVKGIDRYGAGAAYLLLLAGRSSGSSSAGATFSADVAGGSGPVSQEQWREERAQHERNMQAMRNQSRIRQERYNSYEKNPKISAAAREHAGQKANLATVVVLIFCAVLFLPKVTDLSGDGLGKFLLIAVVCSGLFTMFIRGMAYKDAYKKKVWELGDRGYGVEATRKASASPAKKPAQSATKKPADKSAPKPTPKPEPKPAPNPQPAETTKIVFCPHCGAKCCVPTGNGRIRITCPNPSCMQPFETDT